MLINSNKRVKPHGVISSNSKFSHAIQNLPYENNKNRLVFREAGSDSGLRKGSAGRRLAKKGADVREKMGAGPTGKATVYTQI
jgi:hypothetical protein